MICLYERAGEVAQIHTSYDQDKAEYVLRFIDPVTALASSVSPTNRRITAD